MKTYEYKIIDTNKMYIIKVGQNAQDNWDIIDAVDGSDIWFHVKNHPSCHVILKTNGEQLDVIDNSVLRHCAKLCKDGSKFRYNRSNTIIYTEVNNVKKDVKGETGSVFVKRTKKINV